MLGILKVIIMEDRKQNAAMQIKKQKRIIMHKQERIVRDLGDIEHVIESETRKKHNPTAFYFSTMYNKTKRMRNKIISDLRLESD
jgi:hypothetical protein